MNHKRRLVCSLKPKFRIMNIGKQIFVAYYRNGRLISKQPTNNPYGYLMVLKQQQRRSLCQEKATISGINV